MPPRGQEAGDGGRTLDAAPGASPSPLRSAGSRRSRRAPGRGDDQGAGARSLEEYRRRRDFSRTPEPRGGEGLQPTGAVAFPGWANLPAGRRFCVQMHDARRLHFDLRLEHRGVLLSWAVPRGPSLDPSKRRLAVQVEDHPIEYGDFEGVIPEGYGAGIVLLWDAGTIAWKDPDPDAIDGALDAGLLEFALEGVKLHGSFTLVRTGRRVSAPSDERGRQWLLIKRRDAAVVPGMEAVALAWSVKTGRTFEELAATAPPVLRDRALARLRSALAQGSNPRAEGAAPSELSRAGSGSAGVPGASGRPVEEAEAGRAAGAPGSPGTSAALPVTREGELASLLATAPRGPLPTGCQPMLATPIDAPFTAPGWLFELKYDGIRVLATVRDGRVGLRGRHGRVETDRYPELQALANAVAVEEALLDGEVVVLDGEGRSSFELLQQRINLEDAGEIAAARARLPVTFVAFDLLAASGRDLRRLPLVSRKRALRLAIVDETWVRFADHVEEHGEALFAAVRERGGEGIVAKRADSAYLCGRRSRDWLKVKAWLEQDCVILGWTAGRGGRGPLGALVLGVLEDGRLVHVGQVGTGLDSATIATVLRRLQPLRTTKPPVHPPPVTATPVTWVRPELVCTVRFAGWTAAGTLRQPVFRALRDDLRPEDCRREPPGSAPADAPANRSRPSGRRARRTPPATPSAPRRSRATAGGSGGQVVGDDGDVGDDAVARVLHPPQDVVAALEELQRMGPSGTWEIGGRRLPLSNLDKALWPDDGLTKRDLLAYVVRFAPLLLRLLRDRPVAMQVFPDGIAGKHFWRKRIPARSPEWIRTWRWESVHGEVDFVLVDEVATLAWMANRAVIDIHPWHSRIDRPNQPDWAVFDLDPAEGATFADVVLLARLVRVALDHFGLRGYCKVSGQTGLQIYVPIRRGPDYTTVRDWVEAVCRAIGTVVPDKVSWEWSVAKRAGRIRMDYTQNAIGHTLAVAYSPRPAPRAPISAPITWEELEDPSLRPDGWTIRDALERVARVGDPFAGVLSGDQDLPAPPFDDDDVVDAQPSGQSAGRSRSGGRRR